MGTMTLQQVVRQSKVMQDELTGKASTDRLRKAGESARRAALDAVRETPSARGSLADLSMSGWHRGRPVTLGTRLTMTKTSALVTPDRTAGLWRVLESGRAGNAKGARIARGVTRKGNVRYRRVKRNTGATAGKGTWSRAEDKMARAAKSQLVVETVQAFRRTWR